MPEGEKAADAARSIGLVATTSAHGSASPEQTDWSDLAGKEVVLLPDNDPPGRKYADEVASILAKLTPAPQVKIVELPGLPEKGDIVEWIAAQGDAIEPAELRRQLESLADDAECIQADGPEAPVCFRPFPVEVLPEPVRGFVRAAARAIGCDPSFLVLPILAALAGCIGNSRSIQLKRGWCEPPVIWVAIVGPSGDLKSPALDCVFHSLFDLQTKLIREHEAALAEFKLRHLEYEVTLSTWKRKGAKNGEQPPKPPEEPTCARILASDVTTEALATLLRDNPRGLINLWDELAGLLGGFNQYKGGRGSDAKHWLKMHGARNWIVDRKSVAQKTIVIARAFVCVVGAIQPEILRTVLGREHFQDGMAARLLLAFPPPRMKRWTTAEIPEDLEQAMVKLYGQLMELELDFDDHGAPRPRALSLSRSGQAAWIQFFNEHAHEMSELEGDLRAAWSKLEGYAARLALIVHLVRQATGDPTLEHPGRVDAASILAGVAISRWCANEARRIYSAWEETDDQRDQRRLVDFIIRKGGVVTVRQVQQGCTWLKTPGAAETALQQLVSAGLGLWKSTPRGRPGQPTRRFRLTSVYGNPVLPDENCNTVDVDGVDAVEIEARDADVVTINESALKEPIADLSQSELTATDASANGGNKSENAVENKAAADALRAGGMPT